MLLQNVLFDYTNFSSLRFPIKIKLNKYENINPIDKVIPIELISLKLVKDNREKEKIVVAAERNMASFDLSEELYLKIE